MFGDLFAPSLEYPVLEGLIMTKNRVQCKYSPEQY